MSGGVPFPGGEGQNQPMYSQQPQYGQGQYPMQPQAMYSQSQAMYSQQPQQMMYSQQPQQMMNSQQPQQMMYSQQPQQMYQQQQMYQPQQMSQQMSQQMYSQQPSMMYSQQPSMMQASGGPRVAGALFSEATKRAQEQAYATAQQQMQQMMQQQMQQQQQVPTVRIVQTTSTGAPVVPMTVSDAAGDAASGPVMRTLPDYLNAAIVERSYSSAMDYIDGTLRAIEMLKGSLGSRVDGVAANLACCGGDFAGPDAQMSSIREDVMRVVKGVEGTATRYLRWTSGLEEMQSLAQRVEGGLRSMMMALVAVPVSQPDSGVEAARGLVPHVLSALDTLGSSLKAVRAQLERASAGAGAFGEAGLVAMQRQVRALVLRHRLFALIDEVKDSKLSKNMRKRIRVLREVVSTEKSYVDSLDIAHRKYYLPLYAACNEKRPPITLPNLKVVFGSLDALLEFNRSLLAKLEARLAQWPGVDRLGDIFIDVAPYLSCYTSYVNNYDDASKALEKLRSGDRNLSKRLDALKKDSGSTLPLESLLIMPVQRLPRYELLLRELLKYTPEGHTDRANLETAQAELKRLNHSINENRRVAEQSAKLAMLHQEVRSCPFPIVDGSRVYVGDWSVSVTPRGGSRFDARLVVLSDTVLALSVSRSGLDFRGALMRPLAVLSGQVEHSLEISEMGSSSWIIHCHDNHESLQLKKVL